MINYIFGFIFIIGLIYSIFSNRIDITINALLQTPKEALILFLDIYVALIFWGGIIEICKQSGLLRIITNYISILIKPLFKKLDKDSEAIQYMSVNIVSNLLSISSLGSSFGFKAMKELDKLNEYDEVASEEMITFLLINSSGLCLIPTIVVSVRNQFDSMNSAIIMPYVMVVSSIVLVISLFIDWMFRKNGKH